MKLVCLSLVIFAGVFHDVHSGILMERVGDTLERIKCKTQSIGNRVLHRGQNQNLCNDRQDPRPPVGQNQYVPFDHSNNQGVLRFEIWNPFTHRQYNGGYTDIPNSNNNAFRPFSNNQDFGGVNKPSWNNMGDRNIGQSAPVEQGFRSTVKPTFNNVEYGNGQESFVQPSPTNQNSGRLHGSSSSNVNNGNFGQPSPNNQHSENTASVAEGKREEAAVTNISNQNESNQPTYSGKSNFDTEMVVHASMSGCQAEKIHPRPSHKNMQCHLSRKGPSHICSQTDVDIYRIDPIGKQSQNCTVIDVRSDSNNQTGVPNNCNQDGRRFLTAIKANCPSGEIADRNGVCREMYKR